MAGKILAITTIIVALVMATLATTLPLERMHDLITFMRFFETMLPVLAVGALIKYIFCCPHK